MKKANLSIGDKATFTIETTKTANKVGLYDQNGKLIGSTKKYKAKGSKRIWTIAPTMSMAGTYRYYSIAAKNSTVGAASPDVSVNVGTASLAIKGFALNNSALDVGDTVTITVKTGSLPNKVSIVSSDGSVLANLTKPSKKNSSGKTWTYKRKLTEADMGIMKLSAIAGSKYGTGQQSASKTLGISDTKARVISVAVDKKSVKRGNELSFTIVTNAAATSVRINNDKKEKWTQLVPVSTVSNRRTWKVVTVPKKTGTRKFYAAGYVGPVAGVKSSAIKIKVTK